VFKIIPITEAVTKDIINTLK